MDRVKQLSNVSFGGAWSEQIAGREKLAMALSEILQAANRTENEDLRTDQNVMGAVMILSQKHPKGAELKQAWEKALGLHDAFRRVSELRRIANAYKSWLG